MNDKELYAVMYTKMNTVMDNIECVINDIDRLKYKCSESLVLDDNTNYKNEMLDIRDSLREQKRRLKNKIMPEIRQKM